MNLTKILVAIGVFVLALAIPTAVYLSTQKEPIKTRTQAGQEETAIFYLWPAEIHAERGDSIEIDAILSAPEEEITKATVKIMYDPEMLDIISAENGTIFNKYTDKEIEAKKGIITVKAQGTFTGTGAFVSLEFKPRKIGSSRINIISTGTKAENSEGADILQGVHEANIVIK